MFGHQRLVTDIANPNQAAGECAQAIRHGPVITRPLRLTAPPIHASTVSDLSRTCDAFVRAFVGSLQSMRPVHCGAAAVRLGVRDEILVPMPPSAVSRGRSINPFDGHGFAHSAERAFRAGARTCWYPEKRQKRAD
jgi:hypothetical protein